MPAHSAGSGRLRRAGLGWCPSGCHPASSAGEIPNRRQHLGVDASVRGNDLTGARSERRLRRMRTRPAGLLDDQRAAGDVPRLKPLLPEPVEPAGRDVAEIDRRRTEPPHGARAADERREQADDLVARAVHVVGKAGDEQRRR